MRKIKFRGKVLKGERKGEWVYGDLTQYSEAMSYITVNLLADDGTIQVDAKTVGQYTDIKDKNGKEIYEGDIIELSPNSIYDKNGRGEVDFMRGSFRWWKNKDIFEWFCNINCLTKIKIIGNIYENPNLLKQKE